jgi:hypothetical protein
VSPRNGAGVVLLADDAVRDGDGHTADAVERHEPRPGGSALSWAADAQAGSDVGVDVKTLPGASRV